MNDMEKRESSLSSSNSVVMTAREFSLLSRLVEGSCGIKMPDSKRNMLESRLQKRLRSLDMRSFRDYYEFLISPRGMRHEMYKMIDAVTTNKTDFFREPSHFTFLTEKVLPEMVGNGFGRSLRVWSAGCSSGEEPYTLAMVMGEFARTTRELNFSLLGTDICTSVLEKASQGVYEEEKVNPVPLDLKKKYLLRSKDRSRGMVRIVPELRSLVTFRRLNFMDENYGIETPMHIIFCRNVLIYFDRATQERLINNFSNHLVPGGYLFLGHSETISGMNVPVRQVDSTIYRKPR